MITKEQLEHVLHTLSFETEDGKELVEQLLSERDEALKNLEKAWSQHDSAIMKLAKERDEALKKIDEWIEDRDNWLARYQKLKFELEKERDEALKRIEDFKRHVIPCVICEYKDGVLMTRCWLHEKLEEEKRWKEAYREVAVIGTSMRTYEATDAEAKRIFEDQKRVDAHIAFIDHEIKRKE